MPSRLAIVLVLISTLLHGCRSTPYEPHGDAGKSCTDSSECLGECVADTAAQNGSRATGHCSRGDEDTRCADKKLVKDGIVMGVACAR
jgi:hypothetical protein